jgi:hypothetical protein
MVAAVGTFLIGNLLSKYVWALAPPLGDASVVAVRALDRLAGANLPATEQFGGTVVVMATLSFLWGVVYHLGRHGNGD